MPAPLPPPLPEPIANDPTATIKARFVAAVRDEVKKNSAESEGEGCFTAIVLAILVLLSLTIVLIPAVVWFYPRWRLMQRHKALVREWLAFAERAQPVMGFPLMVNSMLREPGSQPAPGLFLICFEKGTGERLVFMSELAARVGAPDPQSMSPEDFAFCSALMTDEEFHPFRRRRLPQSLTGPVPVYAIDAAVSPLLLHGRHISDEMPLVPFMAEASDHGRILQMPYWFIAGTAPPGEAESEAFVLSLGAMSKWSNSRHFTTSAQRQRFATARDPNEIEPGP